MTNKIKYIIQIKNLTSKIRNTTILNKINLNIPQNKIFGFIGPNGAGKTTTINCILGQFPVSQGEIFLLGQKFTKNLTKNIGYSPDDAIYYEHLTGSEHIILFSKLCKLNKKQSNQNSKILLKKLGLEDAKNRKVKEYSKGMKQRLGIAIALINNPKILIFDEPMNGLDPMGRILIKDLFNKLKSQGKTIFFSTHILNDVEEIADQFALIHKGKILLNKNINEINDSLENIFINTINSKKI